MEMLFWLAMSLAVLGISGMLMLFLLVLIALTVWADVKRR